MKSLIAGICMLPGVLLGQSQMYDVLVLGGDVGDMMITRNASGSRKTYSLESYTTVNYGLGKRRDHCVCKMEFENGMLVSSSMENKKNDKLNFYTYINRIGSDGYKIQTEKGLSTLSGAVSYCVYDIFFDEPSGNESVFSERWGKFGTIQKKSDHIFKLEIPGCEDYTYNYNGGKMVKMEVPTFLGKCKFVIK